MLSIATRLIADRKSVVSGQWTVFKWGGSVFVTDNWSLTPSTDLSNDLSTDHDHWYDPDN